jgi:hypothetical protein
LSGSKCQSQGGFGLERDGTVVPTHTAPLSQRESVIKDDIPSLPTTAYFGYVDVVNGDTTLSCPSPPNFTTGDFGRPCTTVTPVSSDLERNISPVIVCQSQDADGLERDSTITHTPTTVTPHSSDSERNISPGITCQLQDGTELEFDSTTSRMSTTAVTQSSTSEWNTSPNITCPSQDGTGLERDSTTTPTPVGPLSQRETVLTSDRPSLEDLPPSHHKHPS